MLKDNNFFIALYERRKEDIKTGKPTIKYGEKIALDAWKDSVRRAEEVLELNDCLGPDDVPVFVAALRAAGLKTFVYTAKACCAIENIHQFTAEGCRLDGLCMAVRQDPDGYMYDVPGIRFIIEERRTDEDGNGTEKRSKGNC